MKPSKNRIYCRDCGRMKTVFDSEEAAMRFIHYNKRDIIETSGYAPTRAYYCDLCCAWHVTSKKDYSQKSLSRRTVDTIMEFNKLKKSQRLYGKKSQNNISSNSTAAPFLSKTYRMVTSVIGLVKSGKLEEAKKQCEYLDTLFENIRLVKGANATRRNFSVKYKELRDKIYNGAIDANALASIELDFSILYDQNPALFNYDENAEGALNVDNIDSYYYLIKNDQKAKNKKPSDSPAAPFLTEAYQLVRSVFSLAKEGKINHAKEQCKNIDLLFEKMTLVKGAHAIRNLFLVHFEKLKKLIFNEYLNEKSLELIEKDFVELFLKNPSIFSYDKNAEGAIIFDLTPENIDNVYYAEQYKKEAKVNYIKNLNALLMSASASIACGDFSDAKKDLIEASELIENLDDQESIKEYSKEIVKLIDKIEIES